MRFSELIRAAGLRPRSQRGDADIEEVQFDSRRCGRGSCFVAVRGWTDDGHKYISQAVGSGAAAVVCEDEAGVGSKVACAVVDDAHEALGHLAQAHRGWPARRLVKVAVTGTKGKSTTAALIREILIEAGFRPGLLGTISYQTGRRSLPAPTTTPDPVSLAEMAAEMVADGCTHLVMEASSHALDQRRTAGLDFRVGVFTNFSGDHMDYHQTMERYFAAKARLFEQLAPEATAVVNRDDPQARRIADSTRASVVWYALGEEADFLGRIVRADYGGTEFTVARASSRLKVRTHLIGRHNVYNCLAATAAAAALGVAPDAAASAIERVRSVPGRMERVQADAPYQVFVDYAHTDDALENALQSLRDVRAGGRVIVVFGCGGDRDRTKRPRMARAAERLADRIVVTSDNPRTEDPCAIVDEIVAGLSPGAMARTDIDPDRRRAIAMAIEHARPGDVVLIAGKGHENYQVIGNKRIHFDDVEVASELMRRREAVP
ncbi:MAG TPA: UDP-N-acetylmuramoyl-L-alanyl-D-glutamate--2,6-diaminopimelate ligase [Phycisphaerae bacterium]|nr:UDP-N-acetylmuramoyl-L-alanyl-D-glutamate--2,6-diaminopimelate ligase [Phycisphaerae bacterium]